MQVLGNLAAVVNVMNGSSDDQGHALTLQSKTDGTFYGSVVVNSDGQTVTYTPDSGYTGPDSFTYTVSDGNYLSTAKVCVNITEVPLASCTIQFCQRLAHCRMTVSLSVPGYPSTCYHSLSNWEWKPSSLYRSHYAQFRFHHYRLCYA